MSLDSSTRLPSVSETLGALYIGVTIAAVLYGVTNLQAVIYYRRYPNDWSVYQYSVGHLLRSLQYVGFLWTFDTVHVALSTYAVYVFLIHFFGDLDGALEYDSWYALEGMFNIHFFDHWWLQEHEDIHELGRHFHKTIIYFISLAVVASLGTVIYVVYDTYVNLRGYHTEYRICFQFENLTIAIPMFYYLHKSRTIIVVPSTATVLLRLMRLVLMSGLATRLNSRSKHHSASQSMEDEMNSLPTALRIASINSEGDVSETDISIPVRVKLNPSKEAFDCQV
ncbi:hypothetical protein EDD18DRAFT_1112519 [Armillaria luteobubalina]|uniref:Uncharacterized protein n=1 Tax=Armillaria luteobubalina TaxID=153913 RepID=A0AA39PFZ4_9AGAR|nr:hypothetical protein EDD18DRAFT_1112519 [Armillaria luteobubalina]